MMDVEGSETSLKLFPPYIYPDIFMPEFPGLRRIGKIRDFEPYIRPKTHFSHTN